MNFSKKKWIVITLVSLVVVWLFVANTVIANIFVAEDNLAKKVKVEDIPQKDEVIISIKGKESVSDIWDSFRIRGAAFCETEKEHLDRKIQLILISDKNAYVIPATNAIRVDVYYEYEGIKKMPDGNIGFESEFATINIKNGIYDVLVYVWENEEAYGISDSRFQLIKDNENVSLERKSEAGLVQKNFNLMEEGRFRAALDINEIDEDGNLIISGWGVFLDDTPIEYDSYIAFAEGDEIKGVHLAERKTRTDISDAFKTNNRSTGFYLKIPAEKINYQYNKIYLAEKIGDEIKYYLLNKEEVIEAEINSNFIVTDGESVVTAIDKLSVDQAGDMQISGWGTDLECDWTEYDVYIGLVADSKLVSITEATRICREDISNAFSIADNNAGYYTTIPAAKAQEDFEQIVLIKEKEGEFYCYPLKEDAEDVIARKYSLTKEHDFRGAIDSFNKMDDGSASISGWGVDLKKPLDDYNMYIILIADEEIKTVVSAERKEREDICESYGLQDNRTGFWAHIPANNLPDNYDTVVLAIETEDAVSYYQLEKK